MSTVGGVPGVGGAQGDVTVSNTTVVDGHNTAIGPTNGAPTLAHNWYSSAHSPTLAHGHAPSGPGEIALDATTADRTNIHLGDPLRVITPTASLPVTVVGLTRLDGPNPGVAMVYLDTTTAQNQLLAKPAMFTSVTVDAAPGTSDNELRQRLQAALGPDYAISTKEEQAQSSAGQISAFLNVVTYALLGFAGIAVVVGVFLILNTFSMLVAATHPGARPAPSPGRQPAPGHRHRSGRRAPRRPARRHPRSGRRDRARRPAHPGHRPVRGGPVRRPPGDRPDHAGRRLRRRCGGHRARRLPAGPACRRGSPMAALRDAAAPPAPSLRRRSLAGAVLLAAALAVLGAAGTVHADLITTAVLLGAGVAGSLVAAVVLAPVIAQVVVRGAGAGYPHAFGTSGGSASATPCATPAAPAPPPPP